MKNFLMAMIAIAGLGGTGLAMASEGGSCHFHGNKAAAPEAVIDCAAKRKEALVSSGKIDKSWQAIKHENIEQVEGKKGKEWLVTFKDPSAKDESRQTLYMFFTPPGNFVAANFTGK